MNIDSIIFENIKKLVNLGFLELKTVEDVQEFISKYKNTASLIYINSNCGCASQTAIPAIEETLNKVNPEIKATIYATRDKEAAAKMREYLDPLPKTSPSFFIVKDEKPVYAIHRPQIWHKDPKEVTNLLIDGINKYF